MKIYELVTASKWVDDDGFNYTNEIHSATYADGEYEISKETIYDGYNWSECWFMENIESSSDGDVKYEATYYLCDDDGEPDWNNPLVKYTIWESDFLEGNIDGTEEIFKRI